MPAPSIPKFRALLHLLNAVGATLVLLTCVSLAAEHFWIADLLANLRIQGMLAIGVIVVFTMILKCRRMTIALLACVVWHGIWFLPTNTAETSTDDDFSISTINVQTSNRQHDRILDEVRELDTDLVAIVELSYALENAWAESDLADRYPFRLTAARNDGNFGIGLYSKRPFDAIAEEDFSDIGLPSIVADLTIDGRAMRIVATHTLPPMGKRATSIRNGHLQQLAENVREHQKNFPNSNVVVMGDLNLTPWSPCFSTFLRQSELQRSTSQLTPTWFAGPGVLFGLQLDHILISQNLTAGSTIVGKDIGSDHRAVAVSLSTIKR